MKISGYRSSPIQVIKTIEIDDLFGEVKPTTKVTQPPKGYHTSFEYAEKYNVSERTMQRRIKKLWREGKCMLTMHHSTNILGNRIKIPYYKVDNISLLK